MRWCGVSIFRPFLLFFVLLFSCQFHPTPPLSFSSFPSLNFYLIFYNSIFELNSLTRQQQRTQLLTHRRKKKLEAIGSFLSKLIFAFGGIWIQDAHINQHININLIKTRKTPIPLIKFYSLKHYNIHKNLTFNLSHPFC